MSAQVYVKKPPPPWGRAGVGAANKPHSDNIPNPLMKNPAATSPTKNPLPCEAGRVVEGV